MPIAPRLTEAELEKLTPLAGCVIIKKWSPPNVTKEGLHLIEDSNNYQCKRGYVVKFGPPLDPKVPVHFKAGDQVLFSAFAGAEVPMPVGYLTMNINDIIAVLEPDE